MSKRKRQSYAWAFSLGLIAWVVVWLTSATVGLPGEPDNSLVFYLLGIATFAFGLWFGGWRYDRSHTSASAQG